MMNRYRQLRLGIIFAILSPILYGAYPLFSTYTLQCGMTTSTAHFIRFLLSAIMLWLFCVLKPSTQWPSAKNAFLYILLGAIVYSAQSTLYLLGITSVPTSLGGLIVATYPLFVTLFSIFLGREKFSLRLIITYVVCLFGLGLAINVETGSYSLIGLSYVFGASIAYATYIVCGSFIDESGNPIIRTAFIVTGAFIYYTGSGLIKNDISFEFHPMGWIWIICIAVFITVVGTIFFWTAVNRIGAVSTSVFGFLEPVSTILLAVVILNETLSFRQAIGIFVVLFCVITIQFPQFRTVPTHAKNKDK